jgi:hypothetical protein
VSGFAGERCAWRIATIYGGVPAQPLFRHMPVISCRWSRLALSDPLRCRAARYGERYGLRWRLQNECLSSDDNDLLAAQRRHSSAWYLKARAGRDR